LKNEPRHVEAHYNLANLYFDAGDLQLAKLHYESAADSRLLFSRFITIWRWFTTNWTISMAPARLSTGTRNCAPRGPRDAGYR
jgi:hypothetical protein